MIFLLKCFNKVSHFLPFINRYRNTTSFNLELNLLYLELLIYGYNTQWYIYTRVKMDYFEK